MGKPPSTGKLKRFYFSLKVSRLRKLPVCLLLLFCLFIAGCGGGGGGGSSSSPDQLGGATSVGGGGSNPNPSVPTAQVVLNFTLLNRAIPGYIEELQFTGLTESGTVVYGPIRKAKASRIVLESVPLSVSRLRIDFLQNSVARGVSVLPLSLSQDSTVEIVDPPFEDIDAVLNSLSIDPIAPIPVGLEGSARANGLYNTGESLDITSLVSWSSSDPDTAGISAAGVITPKKVGAVTITASAGSVTRSVQVVISEAVVTRISTGESLIKLPKGLTQTINVMALLSDGSQRSLQSGLQYQSSNSEVAEVDAGGTILATGVGSCEITATTSNMVQTVLTVQVRAAEPVELRLNSSTSPISKGANLQVEAYLLLTDGTFTDVTDTAVWNSSDSGIATVLSGQIMARTEGAFVVSASSQGLQASRSYIVGPASLQSLKTNLDRTSFPRGIRVNIGVEGIYSDGSTQTVSNLGWSSSDESVAGVTSSGELVTHKPGIVTLTVQEPGGVKLDISLEITDAVLKSLILSQREVKVPLGLPQQVSVEGCFSDGSQFELGQTAFWSSNDLTTASVSSDGTISGLKKGRTQIFATSLGGVEATFEVAVIEAQLESIDLVAPRSMPLNLRFSIRVYGHYSDGTRRIIPYYQFAFDKPEIVEFGVHFVLTPLAPGTLEVTVSAPTNPEDLQGEYMSETVSVEFLDVALESLSIETKSNSIPVGIEQSYGLKGRFADGSVHALPANWTVEGTTEAFFHGSYLECTSPTGTSGTVRGSYDKTGASVTVPFEFVQAKPQSLQVLQDEIVLPQGRASAQIELVVTWDNGYVESDFRPDYFRFSGPQGLVRFLSSARVRADHKMTGSGILTVHWENLTADIPLTVIPAQFSEIYPKDSRLVLPKGITHGVATWGSFIGISEVSSQLVWSSSNPTVAAVIPRGEEVRVETYQPGAAVLTATDPVTGLTCGISVTVVDTTIRRMEFDEGPTFMTPRTRRKFQAIGIGENGQSFDLTEAVSWATAGPPGISVDNRIGYKGTARLDVVGAAVVGFQGLGTPGQSKSITVSESATLSRLDFTQILALKINPVLSQLYVLTPTALEVLDPVSLSTLRTVVFTRPSNIDVTPDGQRVLVTHRDRAELTVLNTGTFEEQAIPLPSSAVAVTAGDGQWAYVAATRHQTPVPVNLNESYSLPTPETSSSRDYASMAFNSESGILLVGGDGVLYRYRVDGSSVFFEESLRTGDGPVDVALHPDGKSFLSNRGHWPLYFSEDGLFRFDSRDLSTLQVAPMTTEAPVERNIFSKNGKAAFGTQWFGKKLSCFDPRTGSFLWEMDDEAFFHIESSADGKYLFSSQFSTGSLNAKPKWLSKLRVR